MVAESYRLRISYEGPDRDGLFTARAIGVPGDPVGMGRTREEAMTRLAEHLGPAVPQQVVTALSDGVRTAAPNTGRPTGMRRYWQNLVRGWAFPGMLMCVYGAV